MIYEGVEFFNIREIDADKFTPGVRLARIGRAVREKLNPHGRTQGVNATCGEIRFVTDAPHFTIRLMARKLSTWPTTVSPQMRIMRGNIEYGREELPYDRMRSFPFDTEWTCKVRSEVLRPDPSRGFDPKVWRFVLPEAEMIFGGIETHGYGIRPPRPEETPAHRCLCHGSSITNSWLDGWPALLGHLLGMDVMNLGLSGGCCLEPELADYLASPEAGEYDRAILELGINVVGTMSPAEFATRTDRFLDRITRRNPAVKLAMITVFPFFDDRSLWTAERLKAEGNGKNPAEEFRTIIREKAEEYRTKGFAVSVVEGPEIDTPELCWSWDMLHPRHLGNPVIAFRLAEILQKEWNPPPPIKSRATTSSPPAANSTER